MKRVIPILLKKTVGVVILSNILMMLVCKKLPPFAFSSIIKAALNTLVLGYIVFLVIRYSFSKPLNRISEFLAKLSKGDLDARLEINSPKEMKIISQNVNLAIEGLTGHLKAELYKTEVLSAVTDGIDEAIMLIDKDFKVLWANKKVRDLSHLKQEAILGSFCYGITHHRDAPCEAPNDICPIAEIIKNGKPITVTHTHYDQEGKAFFVDVTAYPIKDEKGENTRFIHMARNVTERLNLIKDLGIAKEKLEEYNLSLESTVKERTMNLQVSIEESERQRLAILNILEDVNAAHQELTKINMQLKTAQAQLIQGAKMVAIGQLAGGVAHEINNPLTGVLNNVQLIKMELEGKKGYSVADFKELLDVIEESGQRCKRIVATLLDFSRTGKGFHEPLNLTDVLDKAVALANNEIKFGNIKLIREYASGLPQIKGDTNQLQQVFLNMLNNAKWALRQTAQAQIILKVSLSSDNSSVVAEVSDNGCGIEKKDLTRIFEPFFTTKKPGEGTGLGLSVSYGIIKEHNGSVEIESEGKDKGATFRVILP
ncbi:MAG: ATP-binding protein, partial [Candidatus Omnitrophota bacterium]|nr:ATP-binding protein [Candidatus Omnitrophota bacterium]